MATEALTRNDYLHVSAVESRHCTVGESYGNIIYDYDVTACAFHPLTIRRSEQHPS
jgi:hypothetical protein